MVRPDFAILTHSRPPRESGPRYPAAAGAFAGACNGGDIHDSLLRRLDVRLIFRLRYWQASLACSRKPRLHCDLHFSERLFGRPAERGTGLQVRDVGNPARVLLGPEHDDGVAI